MKKYIMLTANNNSLRFSIPYEFKDAFGLKPGDTVLWESEGDKVTLTFYKVKVERTLAQANEASQHANV
jgi:bifunctional DNA-binding transcriptional regulator/antitoxin component of YhaV-PrlF toxin-antitoxin module